MPQPFAHPYERRFVERIARLARRQRGKLLAAGLVIAFGALIAACVPQENDRLPTIAVIPSDTPRPTATVTRTRTPTPTRTPTSTATLTPSQTLTPTITPSPTRTPRPTNTPRPTLTPSVTPSLTPVPTSTPIPTSTPLPSPTPPPTLTPSPTVVPQILSFSADVAEVPAGGATTLRWSTTNTAAATLEQINSAGQLVGTIQVAPSGQQTVQFGPNDSGQVTFRLSVKNGRNTATRAITVQIRCANPYFFRPEPAGCAIEPVIRAGFVFQQFERGVGIYVPTTRTVYLLSNEGTRVNAYPIDWDYSALPNLNPPAGLFQPQGEIGYVFARKAWSDGRSVVDVVGWGSAPALGYDGMVQRVTATDVYIKRPDGAVYRLALAGVGTWTAVGIAN